MVFSPIINRTLCSIITVLLENGSRQMRLNIIKGFLPFFIFGSLPNTTRAPKSCAGASPQTPRDIDKTPGKS